MAAFNILGRIFTTEGHGKAHVDRVLSEHGITVDWQDGQESPPKETVRGEDGVLYLANTVEYDANGNFISGQWFHNIW